MATKLKLRATARFLASFFNGLGTKVRIDGLARYLDLDYTKFQELTSSLDPADSLVAIFNKATLVWNTTTLGTILSAGQTTVVKTTSGDVNVAASDGVIVLNKASGAATAVNLPLAASKIGPVLVTDLKLDAGTNNITITPTAPETIQGQATYTLASNGASLFLRPVPGIGYVI